MTGFLIVLTGEVTDAGGLFILVAWADCQGRLHRETFTPFFPLSWPANCTEIWREDTPRREITKEIHMEKNYIRKRFRQVVLNRFNGSDLI